MPRPSKSLFATIGPGVLVAATGVGAGDLATATFTGSQLGTAILWAVVVGACLKYMLNEGLARWQLATETTLLEGCVLHMGAWVRWGFLIYLVIWSYLVAIALISACGVAATAIFPIFDDPATGKIVFGVSQSLLAVLLVLAGGYRLFEKVMAICIGSMFMVVLYTAAMLRPSWPDLLAGLSIPRIPNVDAGGLQWTLALLGGVGGTVTVLCYGYWIREEGRRGIGDLKLCRIDLGVGYGMTAMFGLAMVVIGSELGSLEGKGARLIVEIADVLQTTLGPWGGVTRWAFLVGAWGAFFSSLLGVWQSVPYLFADCLTMPAAPAASSSAAMTRQSRPLDARSPLYRGYLVSIAVLPIAGLFWFDFRTAVKIYALVGAAFMPMLATALIYLNGSARRVGDRNRNSLTTTGLLVLTLAFFLMAAGSEISRMLR